MKISLSPSSLAIAARAHPAAAAAALYLGGICTLAVFANWLAPYDWNATGVAPSLAPPNLQHWFGADVFGRDIFSRVIAGGRYSIAIGLLTLVLALVSGTMLGMLLGFAGGKIDSGGSRLVDVMLGVPSLVVAVMVVSIMGVGLVNVAFAVATAQLPHYARVVRAATLVLRGQLFIEASVAIGARPLRALVGTTMGVPFGFSLNTSRGPFQDLRVRQAFMHAIDRHWISQNLLFGVIDPAWGPLSSSSPEYWPGVEKYYPFNLTAAAKLLDEAGWRMGADGIRQRGGHRLALYLPILLEPAMGVVLQAHARRAGFDLQIEQVTRERQQQHIFANDYDLLSLRWVYADAGVLDVPFLSKNVPAPGRFSFNWSRYQNATLDAALTSAAAAGPEKRRDQYGEVQRLIMDQAIFLPVHEEIYDVVYSNRIAGLRLTHGNAQAAFAGVRIAT